IPSPGQCFKSIARTAADRGSTPVRRSSGDPLDRTETTSLLCEGCTEAGCAPSRVDAPHEPASLLPRSSARFPLARCSTGGEPTCGAGAGAPPTLESESGTHWGEDRAPSPRSPRVPEAAQSPTRFRKRWRETAPLLREPAQSAPG